MAAERAGGGSVGGEAATADGRGHDVRRGHRLDARLHHAQGGAGVARTPECGA